MGTFCDFGYSCMVSSDADVHYCEDSSGASVNVASGTEGAARATSRSVATQGDPTAATTTAVEVGPSKTTAVPGPTNTGVAGGSSHSGAANNQRSNALQLLPFIIGPLAVL
jgi:hypothetical protein